MRRLRLAGTVLAGGADGASGGVLISGPPATQISWILFTVCSIMILMIRKAKNAFRPQMAVSRITTLRRERQEPAGSAMVAQLLARRYVRQHLVDRNRRKQDEPK